MPLDSQVLAATRRLCSDLASLQFAAPVTHVYNPLLYARRSHNLYVKRFATREKKAIFLGMNPGPYGMAQTGIPFGEIPSVRDWMGIETPVDKPDGEHPKRPVTGFACTRSEVSGRRLWGAIAEHFGSPESFFADHYVANYCPLVFMEEGGRNRTPDKLPVSEKEPVFEACDRHLRRLVELFKPDWVIGVGAFAETRARETLASLIEDGQLQVGRVLHPSPASPKANRGWAEAATKELCALGICGQKSK
jgi:single-strand selective monofunctional uracil DNA glycosylase